MRRSDNTLEWIMTWYLNKSASNNIIFFQVLFDIVIILTMSLNMSTDLSVLSVSSVVQNIFLILDDKSEKKKKNFEK